MGRLLLLGGTIFVLGTLLTKVVLAQGEDGFISDDGILEELAPPYEQQYTYTTPKCCKNPTIKDVAYLLVSTMDGKLVALDIANEGNIVWETDKDGQPLLSGTLGSMPPIMNDDKSFSLVPALDGSLYMYSIDDRLLEPIPLNADMLLQASVKIGHDAVAGGKIVTTTGIDPITGKIRYHCGTTACETSNNDLPSSTLVFRRISNSVRAVDALTGNERWNLSVAEYEASLVLDRMNSASYTDNPSRFGFLFQPPDGIITAKDACGNVMWSRSVGGHIAKIWLLENAQLNELSLFDSANIQSVSPLRNNADSWFYLGTVNHEPFIMHSKAAKSELRRLAKHSLDVHEINHAPGTQLMRASHNVFEVQDTTLDGLLSLSYRQSFTGQRNVRSNDKEVATNDRQMQVVSRSVGSCSSSDSVALIGERDMRRSALRDFEMPDEGWFVMKPRTPSYSQTDGRFSKPVHCAANFVRKIEAKLDSAWNVSLTIGLVSLFSVVAGVAASFGIVKYRKRNVGLPQLVTSVSMESTKSTSDSRKTAETRSTSCGPSVAGIAHSTDVSVTPINRQRRSTASRNSSSEPFESKFLVDFDPLCCLGRGGFGVVFKAKHLLDEADYAVKRIAVANNDKSIERVLREVRAMAKLEHNGIIRYYHTWIERPPKGWQEEADRDLLKRLKGKNTTETQEIENEVGSLVEEICDIIEASKGDDNTSETTSDFSLSKSDDSSDGSWAEPSGALQQLKPKSNFLADSSSGSESDNESLDSASPNHRECSDSVIFDQPIQNIIGSEDSESIAFIADLKVDSASISKNNISNLGTELVLATTVDEDLLATTSTSSHVYLYIQMQLCQERTLHSWLSNHRNIQDRTLEKMKSWLAQLCSAVGYIHSQKLIHRDLKPQNIFFSSDDNLKVGDLGLVTKCMANGEYPEVPQNEVSNNGPLHTDNVGTRSYMSPEQLQNKSYDFKVDVFSLGLIYCELIVPLKTVMERSIALKNLQNGVMPDVLKNYNAEERDMISWMTKINPEDRPTCEEILCHEYLSSVQRFERKRYSSEKVKIAQYIQNYVSSSLFRLKKANKGNNNDLKEEEFFDAEEPMEPNAIFQVVSASQLPNGPTENFRMQKESLIRFFRTEEITHPHYWIRGHQAFGKREGTPDFVYVMNGKWNEQTPRDSKLYRFTVLDSHVQPLWNHLKRATSIAPGNFVRLWIETLSEGEQDDAIASELRSLPDSGFPSDNFIAPEFALYVNKDRKWECIRTEHRRYTYVYLLMLKTKSLKQLTNVTPPLASFDNRSFYISRLKLLAEYIERLHIRNIAHGNISMRNVYYLDEGFNVKVFISSECYYFALEAIRGSADVAKKRRKFFDADQRENPVNVEMACDVFAFGLIIVELLGSLETNEKNAVTRSIRLQTVMDTLNAFRNFDSCRMQFGKLLEQIFLPRPQRIKMGGVVEHMQRITRNMQI